LISEGLNVNRGKIGLQQQPGKVGWISSSVLYAFLVIVILFPAILQSIKNGFLALIGVCAFWVMFHLNWRLGLHKTVFFWWIFYLCLGLLFIFWGHINGAVRVLPIIKLYVLYPIAYMVLVTLIRTHGSLVNVLRILIFCTIPMSVLVILQVLSVMGLTLPGFEYIVMAFSENGLTNELSYTPRVLSSLIFLLPFMVGCLAVYSGKNRPVPRAELWFCTVLSLIAVMVGQRHVLLLILFLTPFILVALASFLRRKERRNAILSLVKALFVMAAIAWVAAYSLGGIMGWETHSLLRDFAEAFDFKHDESAMIRAEQFSALMEGVSERPVFGAGLGVGSDKYIRDPEKPWNYELRYVALLFQTGIVGFILYMSGVIWILWTGVRVIAARTTLSLHMVPMLAGFCGALVAEATNPYLNQFGHLWMLFFPVAVINMWLLDRAQAKKQSIGNFHECR